METLKLLDSKQLGQESTILITLLKDGIKNQVLDITSDLNLSELMLLLNESSDGNNALNILFSEVRNTIISNIKVGKSKIDSKEYFVNIEDNSVSEKGFDEIVELIQRDGNIIFQACDYFIDGYYAYYDFNTGEIISKKSDKIQYNFNNLLN